MASVWSGDLLAYMDGWMDVRSYGSTVTKTNISRTDGLPYFLTHGAPPAPIHPSMFANVTSIKCSSLELSEKATKALDGRRFSCSGRKWFGIFFVNFSPVSIQV